MDDLGTSLRGGNVANSLSFNRLAPSPVACLKPWFKNKKKLGGSILILFLLAFHIIISICDKYITYKKVKKPTVILIGCSLLL